MAENSKKGGAGKFFLGAVLGSIAGALASKFISAKNEEDSAGCTCNGKCECTKNSAEKSASKNTASKKENAEKVVTKKTVEKTTKK